MFKKNKKGYYQFEEFSKEGVIGGFTTVDMGTMVGKTKRDPKDLSIMLDLLHIKPEMVVGMKQTHGNTVFLAKTKDRGKIIDKTDALLTKEKKLFLYGTFADCIPLFVLDKKRKILGIIHSGWRGTFAKIPKVTIEKMVKSGSNPKNILVGIGPSIRSCCFEVDEKISLGFAIKFNSSSYAQKRDKKLFLNLQQVVIDMLKESGVNKKNIIDSNVCTKDKSNTFFSYRSLKNKDNYPVFAGIIGRYE